jgi:hypothetical protein
MGQKIEFLVKFPEIFTEIMVWGKAIRINLRRLQ